jgi:hypothetical protein
MKPLFLPNATAARPSAKFTGEVVNGFHDDITLGVNKTVPPIDLLRGVPLAGHKTCPARKEATNQHELGRDNNLALSINESPAAVPADNE